MEQDVRQKSAVVVRLLKHFAPDDAASIGPNDFVFDAPGVEPIADACAGIVLTDGDEQRAATLLGIGAPLVFLGEAALRDSTVVNRLVTAFGGERIGIHAPVRRQTISWSFETVSNADFKTVTPSNCEPAWEVLMANGASTGTLAAWWLAAMRDLGATQFIVRTDIRDDTDLNLCADLVERLGDALWLAPPADPAVPLADWVRYGQARRLALIDDVAVSADLALHEVLEAA
jgi:hypothetical protein